MKPSQLTIPLLFAMLIVAGCAAPVQKQEQAGFLADYSQLSETDELSNIYVGPNLGKYSSFIIDPVSILFTLDPDKPEFDQAEIDDLKDFVDTKLKTALTKNSDYKIVDSPAAGVARIKVGITSIDASTGAYNVLIYTKITGAGLGGVATESEVTDSITGEQLAAAIHWGNGSRMLRAGFTPAGDAKILIGRWIKLARAAIDEAHGISK
jgi:hypothetical protein